MNLTLEIKSGYNYKIEIEEASEFVSATVYRTPCNGITKEISREKYQDLIDRILDINFAKVLYENAGNKGLDGYTLILTLSINYHKSASIAVWSPETKSNPETTKFMKVYKRICEIVSDIFPQDCWDKKRNEPLIGW